MDLVQFRENMMKIAVIGQEKSGGISRIFGSGFYDEAAEKLQQYMKDVGLKTWMDSVGNVHGVLACGRPDAEEILIGSHLDTVKEGGIFDGLLGVFAGIECIKELQSKHKILDYDIHIIATNGEEGNELGGTFGSRAIMGYVDTTDEEFLKKAEKYHYFKEDFEKAIYDTKKVKCYLELHIEQGKTLEESKKKIGIVTGIVGLQRYEITVNGKSNHAGTTMMEYRDDALVKASRIIVLIDEIAKELGHNLVATCNKMTIHPNALAVISDKVVFTLECRNQDEQLMAKLLERVQEALKEIPGVQIKPLIQKKPVNCNKKIVNIVEEICKEEKIAYCKMPSGATHDGNYFARRIPIGMIFVPSIGGISHSKEEKTEWEDVETGLNLLYQTILKIGKKEEEIC